MARLPRKPAPVVETPDLVLLRATWTHYTDAVNAWCTSATERKGRRAMDRIGAIWDRLGVDPTGVDPSCPWTVDGNDVVPNPVAR